jgi:hypothetical protein
MKTISVACAMAVAVVGFACSSSSNGSASSDAGMTGSDSGGGSGSGSGGGSGGGLPETPITLASGQSNPVALVSDGTSVYWFNSGTSMQITMPNGSINKVPVGGGTVTTIASNVIPNGYTSGTQAMALSGGNVLFLDSATSDASIVDSVPTGGSTVTTPVMQNYVTAMVANSTTVFLLDSLENEVFQAPAAGGMAKLLDDPVPDGGNPMLEYNGIAVDSQYIYWTQEQTGQATGTGAVLRIPIGGGTVTTLVSSLDQPWYIVVDSTSLYWNDQNDGTLLKAPLAGGTPTTLAGHPNTDDLSAPVATPVGLALDAKNVYWANSGNATVMSVPIGGGAPVTIAHGASISAFAADSANLYWVNAGDTIDKVAKP